MGARPRSAKKTVRQIGRIACLASVGFSGTLFSIVLGILVYSLVVGKLASEPKTGCRVLAWWSFLNLVVLPVGFLATTVSLTIFARRAACALWIIA